MSGGRERLRDTSIHRAATLISITPLALGPLFIHLPASRTFFELFSKRAFFVVALFLVWAVLRFWVRQRVAPYLKKATAEKTRPRNRIVTVAGALLCAIPALLLIQSIRYSFADWVFYLCLFYLGTVALRDAFAQKAEALGAGAAGALSSSALGLLSFAAVSETFHWEPLLIALSVGVVLGARDLVRTAAGPGMPGPVEKVMIALLAAGPLLMGSLIVTSALPPVYGVVFVSLLGIPPLSRPPPLPLGRSRELVVEMTAIAYVAMLMTLALIIS